MVSPFDRPQLGVPTREQVSRLLLLGQLQGAACQMAGFAIASALLGIQAAELAQGLGGSARVARALCNLLGS